MSALAPCDVKAYRHSGPALVNFGSGWSFDYTAYGDTLSVAARLETANKQYGTASALGAIELDLTPHEGTA